MKKFSVIAIAMMLFVAFAQADSFHSKGADKSRAIRVYNGDTQSVSMVITTNGAGSNCRVVIGTCTNTIDGDSASYDIVSELAAAIGAATNVAGTPPLIVDTDCAVSTDSTDGELLDGTYTAAAGKWFELLWDTSAALHYDVYLEDQNVKGSTRDDLILKNITCDPTGTGNATLAVYVDTTNVWQKTYVQPSTVSGTNDSAFVIANTITIDENLNLPVGRKSVLVRVSRATTATTGVLCVKVE